MKAIIDGCLVSIPAWANWVAVDKSGAMYAYENEPYRFEDGRWYADGRSKQLCYLKDPAKNWERMKYCRGTGG